MEVEPKLVSELLSEQTSPLQLQDACCAKPAQRQLLVVTPSWCQTSLQTES